jgi:Ca2+-binding RTX toxin-like protein
VIVWSETQSGGVQEVRAALSNNSGVFGAPVTLASEAGAEFPQVDMGADGSALAVWDVNTASDPRVMASGAPAGQPFGAERLVESLGQGAGDPEVAVNASGQAFVAYNDVTPQPCPGVSCAIFWIEMELGSVTGAFTPAGGIPPNAESGYSFVSHDVALDDSGAAAILTSGSTPDGSYGVLARTSDTSGTFGPVQELSGENQVGGPGIADDEMELVAAGGEFSAIWSNDVNADGQTNEASMSSTSQGTFAEAHQVTGSSPDAFEASVARSAAGDVVAVWSDFQDELLIGTPVNLTAPAAVYGTSGPDNLAGTGGADSAWLGRGNDRFNGRGGNDRINGEAGADFLDGGAGRNVLNGGPGKDTCVKRSRRDTLTSCERVRRNH